MKRKLIMSFLLTSVFVGSNLSANDLDLSIGFGFLKEKYNGGPYTIQEGSNEPILLKNSKTSKSFSVEADYLVSFGQRDQIQFGLGAEASTFEATNGEYGWSATLYPLAEYDFLGGVSFGAGYGLLTGDANGYLGKIRGNTYLTYGKYTWGDNTFLKLKYNIYNRKYDDICTNLLSCQNTKRILEEETDYSRLSLQFGKSF